MPETGWLIDALRQGAKRCFAFRRQPLLEAVLELAAAHPTRTGDLDPWRMTLPHGRVS